jgi:CSLREA domain-containing protein
MPGMAIRRVMRVEKRASTIALFVLALLITALMGLVLGAKPAHAKTFTVNSTGDALDISPPNGICDVDPRVFVSQCTLREALAEANDRTQNPGEDTINFNIPPSSCNAKTGVCTITPASALPNITEAVIINGYTQRPCSTNPAPCSRPNNSTVGTNAKLLIQLNGANTSSSFGLSIIGTSNSLVRGIVINRFFTAIFIDAGPAFTPSTNNSIVGNFLGTDPGGTLDRGNLLNGVSIEDSNDNTVGGATRAARNLISGNGQHGVGVQGSGNQVLGNLIGTKKDGTTALGNSQNGVTFFRGPNTLGDDTAGGSNVIAFSGQNGVVSLNIGSYGNAFLRNSIFSNGELGIDLGGNGRTPNDAGDIDDGPNHFQNFPVVSSAQTVGATTTIEAKLNSTPSTTFVVRFYSNPPDDNEGKRYLGQTTVNTLASGNTGTFSFTPTNAVAVGQRITATATTDPGGDTSEFSGPREVTGAR